MKSFPLGTGEGRHNGLAATRQGSAAEEQSHATLIGALDRIVRPSAEHQINEENRVVKDEDDVGAGKD